FTFEMIPYVTIQASAITASGAIQAPMLIMPRIREAGDKRRRDKVLRELGSCAKVRLISVWKIALLCDFLMIDSRRCAVVAFELLHPFAVIMQHNAVFDLPI